MNVKNLHQKPVFYAIGITSLIRKREKIFNWWEAEVRRSQGLIGPEVRNWALLS
jgi:hypothetical protein